MNTPHRWMSLIATVRRLTAVTCVFLAAALTLTGCAEQVLDPDAAQVPDNPLFKKCPSPPCGGGGEDPATPIVFNDVQPANARSQGAITCGLDVQGKAYCWGWNGYRTLGIGNKKGNRIRVPTPVLGGHTFHVISVGFHHTCGIKDEGNGEEVGPVYCWGNNDYGQVGNGSPDMIVPEPVPVSGSMVFRRISSGGHHTCGTEHIAGSDAGPAYCWGINDRGQLGNGSTSSFELEPVPVAGNMIFRTVVAGFYSTCAITEADEAFCWGDNREAQLANGTVGGFSAVPVPASGGRRFEDLAIEYWSACGLTAVGDIADPGTILCWGDASKGGPSVPTPLDLGGVADEPFKSLTASYCAIGASDQAYCWAGNEYGQLGNGTYGGISAVPVPVETPRFFSSIGGKGVHTCGIALDGFAYCWGWNYYGELGDGTTNFSDVPVKVARQ